MIVLYFHYTLIMLQQLHLKNIITTLCENFVFVTYFIYRY
jgi:hypothetical protein